MNVSPRGLGFAMTVVESARQTFLRLRHGRRVWLYVLLLCLLTLAVWVLAGRVAERGRPDGRSLFSVAAWWLHANVVVPWATIFLGVQAVHGPLEDRTFQYLFVRPVARAALLLGNWLAVAAVGAGIGALGSLALFAGMAAHEGLWPHGVEWRLCGVFAQACACSAVAYAAVAVLFSAAFRRPLVWSGFFVVGLQMLTANLPVSAGLRSLTITDPVRRLVLEGVDPDPRLADALWPAEAYRPDQIGSPIADLAWLTAFCLVVAAWVWSRSEYEARERD